MAYLTYEEYKAYGGKLEEAEFTLCEFRARKRIDYLTDCRVSRMREVPEEVKLCMMQVMAADQKLSADTLVEDPIVASYNTDGYSESYGSASEQADIVDRRLDKTIQSMLYGVLDDYDVPLLYRGAAGRYPVKGWKDEAVQ